MVKVEKYRRKKGETGGTFVSTGQVRGTFDGNGKE